MNKKPLCFFRIVVFLIITSFTVSSSCYAEGVTPWTKKQGYFKKTTHKLGFGLKNMVFGWAQAWKESNEDKYDTEWQGFCAGLGKGIIYSATGIIQVATFPFPVNIPDIGQGVTFQDHKTRKFMSKDASAAMDKALSKSVLVAQSEEPLTQPVTLFATDTLAA